ncbi:MAG: gamma-glutamylcyclotransferase [Gammaproteobacteria bacterium]|nr:gamma-glutamylcyclotransferase [Gammaproteobacteria bacterium]
MKYAAYGSNLHPSRLTERIPSAQLVGSGFLPSWSLCFHKRSQDDSGKCSIVAGGAGVHFAVFELTAADKQTLDNIEGVGVGYSEIMLSIPGFGDCVSYIAEASHVDDTLQPYDWYKELVLEGMRFHGFPGHYVRPVESITALGDPDPERSAKNWETVELVKARS